MPETWTKLYFSIPAWRMASSSDCGRYLCLPTPFVKNTAVGIGVIHSCVISDLLQHRAARIVPAALRDEREHISDCRHERELLAVSRGDCCLYHAEHGFDCGRFLFSGAALCIAGADHQERTDGEISLRMGGAIWD